MSVTNNARGIAEGLAFRAPATAVRVRGLSDRAVAWLFILPTMLLLLAINIFPLIWAIRLSFTGLMANLPTPARFIGHLGELPDNGAFCVLDDRAAGPGRPGPRLAHQPEIPRP
jgi:hypothetical protein